MTKKMRINRILTIVLLLLISVPGAIAQNYYNNQRGRNRSIVPRTNTEPSKKDYEKDLREKLDVHIQNYISELEVDDFLKHIIKQRLESYYDEKLAIIKREGENREDKQKRLEYLNDNHFNELKGLTTEEVLVSIQDFIRSDLKAVNNRKKEKKKKKKKKKNN